MPLFVLVLVFALLACVGGSQAAAPPPKGIAVVGVDVLTMTAAGRRADQTVLIEGDRIVRVAPRRSVRAPAGYARIDGRGLTLMPGLVDMHIHLAPAPAEPGDAAQRALAVMLGHGVTTARTMAGNPAHLAVRAKLESGALAGPRLYVAAPAVNVTNAKTAEAARAAVSAAKTARYDLIKSHHLDDLAVWQAVQEEAARVGLPVAGHVTNAVGLERALAAGQQVEHLDGALLALLPEGSPARSIDFAQIPPPPVLEAVGAAGEGAVRDLAAKVARSGGHQVPTLALFETIADVATPTATLAAAPEMRFVPDAAVAQWSAQRDQLRQMGFTPELGARFIDLRRRLALAYHRAGAPLMTGSDTAQAFHVWGPGLIEEIEALAAAGLTPLEALRSATVVPRDYFRSLPNGGSSLGWKADFGTVEPGARADLILVEGDPARDLSALRRLRTVIAAGRVHERPALDAMLTRAATDAKAPPPAPAISASPAATGPIATAARPVYVMRHLPAATGVPDPELTAEGAASARRLADFFRGAGLTAVFVTDTRRSRQTGGPLAVDLGLEPTVYDPRDPAALAARVAAAPGPVLVVGHSNTAPDLIARFGGAPIAALGERDYGVVWRVGPPGSTRAFRLDEAGRPATTP